MSDLYQKRVRKRTAILAFFSLLWIVGLLLRLIQLQVINHPRYKAEVLEQSQNVRKIIPKRGTIYDRRGKILARSLPVKSVFFTPFRSETYQTHVEKIRRLKKVLDLSESEFVRIKKSIEKKDSFIWIKRKIDSQKEERAKALSLSGVFFQEENKRYYPQGTLAAHILGGVSIDDKGLSGVEYEYNSELEGKMGKSLIQRDAKKREYHLEILEPAEPGRDLALALDETIQYIAERELEKAILNHHANWGTVIISHPPTGEILALANYPTYNPNSYPPSPDEETNRGIHYNFEPGSTFKVVTASAAIEKELFDPRDTFDCREGVIFIGRRAVRDHKQLGILSFPEVFIHSSNVGAIQIGQRIGEDSFYKTIKSFRLGEKTGIDLPGEENGIFHPLASWTKSSLPSLSIGYEISVTAIQMLQTLNVIANKGLMTNPRVVKETVDSQLKIKERPSPPKRVIPENKASELIHILERVVKEGTGMGAQIPGYEIAGKTGTAQKFDPSIGGYSSTRHLASFVGFVPVEKPAFSMIVVIDEPKNGLHYGGDVAAPVFREIARRVLLYLRVPPQKNPLQTMITAKVWKESDR